MCDRDQAVRRWLDPLKFSVKPDGVYLGYQRYYSEQLRATGILDVDKDDAEVDGYVVHMCARYAWVEINSKLIMVAAMLPMREDEDQLFLSSLEMRLLQEKVDTMNSDASIGCGLIRYEHHGSRGGSPDKAACGKFAGSLLRLHGIYAMSMRLMDPNRSEPVSWLA